MRLGRAGLGVAAAVMLSGTAVAVSPTAAPPTAAPPTTAGRPATARIAIAPQIRVPSTHPTAEPSGGYTPAQIRAAYFVNPLLRQGIDGKGSTIVIVDSFGSPTIRADLGVFDRQFRLATPNLEIIHPAGAIPRFNDNNPTMIEWAEEATLDVEWAHVLAPQARIVLVETPTSENEGTSGFPQIVKAEEYVIAHHLGGVISQSFGATEETFPKGTLAPLRAAYLQAAQPGHDITVLAASGDYGATDEQANESLYYTYPVTDWPASDPLVTSVGGLDLTLNSRGQRTAPDSVWNDPGSSPSAGGGGKSVMFGRPAFQSRDAAIVGDHRGVPDLSMSASCGHPVDVYWSFDGSGWNLICGTSEATPLLAGVIALADQVAGRPLGPINGYLYQMAAQDDPGIVGITHGDNTVTFYQNNMEYTVRGWNAVPGYNLASGLGTIDAQYFVPELAALARKADR
jgi:subtilase family serine protease